jgi:hypothetical protein
MWWGRSDLKKKLDSLKQEEDQLREMMDQPEYAERGKSNTPGLNHRSRRDRACY